MGQAGDVAVESALFPFTNESLKERGVVNALSREGVALKFIDNVSSEAGSFVPFELQWPLVGADDDNGANSSNADFEGFAIVPKGVSAPLSAALCATNQPVIFGSDVAPFTAPGSHGVVIGDTRCSELQFSSVQGVESVDVARIDTSDPDDGGGRSVSFSLRVPFTSRVAAAASGSGQRGLLLFSVVDGYFHEFSSNATGPGLERVSASRSSVVVHLLVNQIEHAISVAENASASRSQNTTNAPPMDAAGAVPPLRKVVFPQRQVLPWFGGDSPFELFSFAYLDVASATLFTGSASAERGLVLLSFGPLPQLLESDASAANTSVTSNDGAWHSVALVMTKASETDFIVQLWIDGATDFGSDSMFTCAAEASEFIRPVNSLEPGRLVPVADAVNQRVVAGGALLLGSARGAGSTSGAVAELHNLRFHRKALSQMEIVRLGASTMESKLMVPAIAALGIGGAMILGSLVVIVTIVLHILSGELSGTQGALSQEDFGELEKGNAADVATKALNPGALRKVLSPAKSSQLATQFRMVRQLSSIVPPVIDVFQTQALLLRGFSFSWPLKFRIPMAFMTVPFALNFDLPTFDISVPSYAPLLCLLVLAVFCLALALYFGEQDNKKFYRIVRGIAHESRSSISLAQLLIKSAIGGSHQHQQQQQQQQLAKQQSSGRSSETIYQWAVAIVRNGWALDAGALQLLLGDSITPTEAKLISAVLGDRPLDAVEAEIRRFSLLRNLKLSSSSVVDFAAALAAATPGTNVCSLARGVNVRLGEKDGAELVAALRRLLLPNSTSLNDASGSGGGAGLKSTAKALRARAMSAAASAARRVGAAAGEELAGGLNVALTAVGLGNNGNSTTLSDDLVEEMRFVCAAERVAAPTEAQVVHRCGGPQKVRPVMRYLLVPDGGKAAVEVVHGYSGGSSEIGAQNFNEFVKLMDQVSSNGVGWPLPELRVVPKGSPVTASNVVTLRNCVVQRVGRAKYSLTCDDGTGTQKKFTVEAEWDSKMTCPFHGSWLISAEEKHYRTRNADGTRALQCALRSRSHFKEVAKLEPCRVDLLFVCPCSDGCPYAVCGGCAETVQSAVGERLTGVATSWNSFKEDPSAVIALVSFLGLQFVYLPATEDALMILGCHSSTRCEFGASCYSNPSTKFLTSAVVAGLMFLVLSIGVPAYWLHSIFTRKRAVAKVIHTPAQWEELLSRDQTILSNLYNKYEVQYMACEPIMLVVRNCALVAAVAFTAPDSLAQLIAVSSVTLANAIFMAVAAPFLDGWCDVLTKADLAHNVLQLAFVSIHTYLSVGDPETEAMVVPMFTTVALFTVVYGAVFFKTVIQSSLDASKARRAGDIHRTEVSWLEVSDVAKRSPQLEVVLKAKRKLYGKKHFQVALTIAHLRACQVTSEERLKWGTLAADALLVAFEKELRVRLNDVAAATAASRRRRRNKQKKDPDSNPGGASDTGAGIGGDPNGETSRSGGPLRMYRFDGLRSHEVHPASWNALVLAIRECPVLDTRRRILDVLLAIARTSHCTAQSETICINAMSLFSAVTGKLVDEDLRGANLGGVSLAGVVENVNFAKADLANANFRGATLQRVNFCEAQLGGAAFGAGREPILPQFHVDFPIKGGNSSKNLALSPDGTLLAAFGFDHDVHMLDTMVGNRDFVLRGHTKRVLAGEFSPVATSKLFVCGDATGALFAWSTDRRDKFFWTAKIVTDDSDTIGNICFTPNGAIMAAGVSDIYHLFRVGSSDSSGAKVTTFTPVGKLRSDDADVYRNIFHPNATHALVIDISEEGFQLRRYLHSSDDAQRQTNELSSSLSPSEVPAPALPDGVGKLFRADNNTFCGISARGHVLIKNTENSTARVLGPSFTTGEQWSTICTLPVAETDMQFTPEGHRVVALSSEGVVTIYDASTSELLAMHQLEIGKASPGCPPPHCATNACFSCDGRFIYLCVVKTAKDGAKVKSVHKFDLARGGGGGGDDPSASANPQHDGRVRSVRRCGYSPYMLSSGSDSTSRLWCSRSGRVLRVIQHPERYVDCVDCCDAGKRIAFAFSKVVELYDVATGRLLARTEVDDMESLGMLSISPNGDRIVVTVSDEHTTPFYVFQVKTAVALGNSSFRGSVPVSDGAQDEAAALAALSASFVSNPSNVETNGMSVTYKIELAYKATVPKEKISDDEGVDTVCILPSNQQVVTGHYEGSMYLFDFRDHARSAALVRCVRPRVSDGSRGPMMVRNNMTSTLFALTDAGGGAVEAFETLAMSKKYSLAHKGVENVSCSHDGAFVVSASKDQVCVWSTTAQVVIHRVNSFPSLLPRLGEDPSSSSKLIGTGGAAINVTGEVLMIGSGSRVSMWRLHPRSDDSYSPPMISTLPVREGAGSYAAASMNGSDRQSLSSSSAVASSNQQKAPPVSFTGFCNPVDGSWLINIRTAPTPTTPGANTILHFTTAEPRGASPPAGDLGLLERLVTVSDMPVTFIDCAIRKGALMKLLERLISAAKAQQVEIAPSSRIDVGDVRKDFTSSSDDDDDDDDTSAQRQRSVTQRAAQTTQQDALDVDDADLKFDLDLDLDLDLNLDDGLDDAGIELGSIPHSDADDEDNEDDDDDAAAAAIREFQAANPSSNTSTVQKVSRVLGNVDDDDDDDVDALMSRLRGGDEPDDRGSPLIRSGGAAWTASGRESPPDAHPPAPFGNVLAAFGMTQSRHESPTTTARAAASTSDLRPLRNPAAGSAAALLDDDLL